MTSDIREPPDTASNLERFTGRVARRRELRAAPFGLLPMLATLITTDSGYGRVPALALRMSLKREEARSRSMGLSCPGCFGAAATTRTRIALCRSTPSDLSTALFGFGGRTNGLDPARSILRGLRVYSTGPWRFTPGANILGITRKVLLGTVVGALGSPDVLTCKALAILAAE
jgi:hypothetical protein